MADFEREAALHMIIRALRDEAEALNSK